ncbi:MAG: hypothetical protein KDB23_01930 [Planctomycetales bacterium]|nr:hypothetical protein [Planctomycetales bacterium]
MSTNKNRPYVVVGSGDLTTSVFKLGDECEGFRYRFNLVRTQQSSGRVSYWLRPKDFHSLLKLLHVLASELAGDGCVDDATRDNLCRIADGIESTLETLDERRSTR